MDARGIFISYRREDTRGDSGRLDDRLRSRYGKEQVFRDVHDSPPGVSFPLHLEHLVSSCRVVIVVIGTRWLESLHTRSTQPDDWVRLEIRTALTSSGVTVIPVLVHTEAMPQPNELPDDIRSISTITAQHLSDNRWDDDMRRLIAVLDPLMWPHLSGQRGDRQPTNWTRKMRLAVAGWFLLLAAFAISYSSADILGGEISGDIESSMAAYLDGDDLNNLGNLLEAFFVASVLLGVGFLCLLAFGSYRGWRWVFWLALVFSGFHAYDSLSQLGSLSDIPDTRELLLGYVPLLSQGLLSLSLFIWMFVGMIRFGPGAWSTRQPGR